MKYILIVLLLAGLIIFLIFREKVGDIQPAVLPSAPVLTGTTGAGLPFSIREGFAIDVYARGVDGARDLELSPGGTVLVSLTGSGRVVALPDGNSDGKSEVREVLGGLNRPHGLAFYQGKLFVAEENRVARYFWNEEELTASLDKALFPLPSGGGHFTRSLVFDKEGRLFISVGSSCNVCREEDERRSAVLVSDMEGREVKVFSKGLRNAVFLSLHPETGRIWVTEMGRDFLGDNLPPDEINILEEGKDYGWPLCYGKRVLDQQFDGRSNTETCRETIPPVFEIAAHSAPLGLTFVNSNLFPDDWQGDLLVAYHGSWNSSVPVGYKVVRLSTDGERVSGEEDFLTDFLQDSQVAGRPVDLLFDKEGFLYISDDKAGVVYRVGKEE